MHANPHIRSSPLAIARWAFGAAAFACVSCANALCIPTSDPQVRPFEQMLRKDPAGVERQVNAALAASPAANRVHRAALYGVLAEAYASLERYADAREASVLGRALLTDQRSDEYVNLAHYGAANTFDEAGIPVAIKEMQALRQLQKAGSPADACLLIALGTLELVSDHKDQASTYLTRAYDMSIDERRKPQRIMAADTLSIVMRGLHNFPQALALNQEVIDWNTQHDATFALATSRFMRGAILQQTGDHKAALVELGASRELGIQLHDAMGVAYADLYMCTSDIESGSLRSARALCDEAQRSFTAAESTDPRKQALSALADIDLREGKASAALQRLNQVLDAHGRDLAPMRLMRIYELRAQAHAALSQPSEALSDYQNYMQRYKASTEAQQSSKAASLRARFETDRAVERSAFLQRELKIRNERFDAQSARLRWMGIAGATGCGVIGLLTYLLIANRRQKQLLSQLALQDDLTDLPNRRRTFELAKEAFESAQRQGTALTIGILDLDHFKRINDRFGHAVGDHVLRQFAHVGCEGVRSTDVLGRWGGEEFLVVLPNTSLDVAMAVIERIREAAARIHGEGAAQELSVSLSAGLATNDGGPENFEEIIASADAALYDAKKSGRNRVCVAPESYSLSSTGIRKSLKHAGIALTTGKFDRQLPPSPTVRARS